MKHIKVLYHFKWLLLLSRFSRVPLCNPIDGSPQGFPVPGILQARTLEWVAISFSKAWKWKVEVKSLSRVRLFATPWTAAHQAPPSMGFSRQEYWSGVPPPSPILVIRQMLLTFFQTDPKHHRYTARTIFLVISWTVVCELWVRGLIHHWIPGWSTVPGNQEKPKKMNENSIHHIWMCNSSDVFLSWL